jgi:L-amino acid N-acyltransferase YncA
MDAEHFVIEPMERADWHSVRTIYLEGIADRNATFETEAPAWEKWDASHLPFCRLVARAGNGVLGWAALSSVSARHCYSGVAEASVYVAGASRGVGIGRALLEALIAESERHGIWTIQGAVFPENYVSLELLKRCGFREVGRRERLAQLDGIWRDVLVLERRSPTVGL